ncbi:MAG: hypothetical protein WAS50_08580 [Nitrospira sp.]
MKKIFPFNGVNKWKTYSSLTASWGVQTTRPFMPIPRRDGDPLPSHVYLLVWLASRLQRSLPSLFSASKLRQFVGIDLGREPVSDETTMCKFRHLPEIHQQGEPLCAQIGEYLAKQGLQVSQGTIPRAGEIPTGCSSAAD